MDIDIHAKTDRELLIIAIEKLNGTCDKVEQHHKDLYNNGFGALFQVKALWLVAGGAWAIFLIVLKNRF